MFQLNQIKEKIWHMHFAEAYDCAMHCIRYQEYYESPQFKNKQIEILDFIDWYIKKYNPEEGIFKYHLDWSGFNIPGHIIFEVHNNEITDPNRYDEMMLAIAKFIHSKELDEDFYLIGTSGDDDETFLHELAHALYATNKKYRNKANKLIKEFDLEYPKESKKMKKILLKMGYCKDVLDDEVQAYLSTGFGEEFVLENKLSIKEEEVKEPMKNFNKNFVSHTKDIKNPFKK